MHSFHHLKDIPPQNLELHIYYKNHLKLRLLPTLQYLLLQIVRLAQAHQLLLMFAELAHSYDCPKVFNLHQITIIIKKFTFKPKGFLSKTFSYEILLKKQSFFVKSSLSSDHTIIYNKLYHLKKPSSQHLLLLIIASFIEIFKLFSCFFLHR